MLLIIYNSILVYLLSILCGILTIIYSLKLYIYCFYHSLLHIIYCTYIQILLIINSLVIDQYLNLYFSLSGSLSLFIGLDFTELLSFLSSDLIYSFSIIILFYFNLLYLLLCYIVLSIILFQIYLFIFCELSYFNFQLIFILFSITIPIHIIEIFTGYYSYYCLYHIHYLISLQYIIFGILVIIFLLSID